MGRRPNTLRFLGIALAAALLGTAGTTARSIADDDAFAVPRERVVATVRTVAIATLKLPKSLSDRKDVPAIFEGLLAAKVAAAGFAAIPSDSYAVAHRELRATLGSLWNPVTGKPDSAKVRALGEGIRDRLKAAGANAILFAEVTPRRADYSGKRVKWDGASESGGQGTGFVDALFGISHSGTLGAYSLDVRLEDMSGALLYRRLGGIQLAGRIEDEEFQSVPIEELFRDEERNAKAVEIALKPLAEH